MKKWQYAHVAYVRYRKPGRPCIDFTNSAMSELGPHAELDFNHFLDAAGERGWELTGTLIPFAAGKHITDTDNGNAAGGTEFTLQDQLDIQWLIFKREK